MKEKNNGLFSSLKDKAQQAMTEGAEKAKQVMAEGAEKAQSLTETISNMEVSQDLKQAMTENTEKAKQAMAEGTEKVKQVMTENTDKAQQVMAEGAVIAKQAMVEGADKAQQAMVEGSEKAKQAVTEGVEKAQVLTETISNMEVSQDIKLAVTEGAEKAKQAVAEGAEKAHALTGNVDILMILDKLLASPKAFKDKIVEKLTTIKEEIAEEIAELEEKELRQKLAEKMIASYTELAATSGDLLNMTNIIPGAFFASIPAGITLFVKFPSELVMSLATIYDLDITDDEIKDLCLILYISGALQEEKAVITPENIETYLKTVNEHLNHEDKKESIKESFSQFGKILTRKGIVNLTGASSEFSINKAFATFLGKQVNNYFQNHHGVIVPIEAKIEDVTKKEN